MTKNDWPNYVIDDRRSKVFYDAEELTVQQIQVMQKRLRLIISEQTASTTLETDDPEYNDD